MIGRYAAGVAAALAAGAAYNVGQLAQKIAVNRLPAERARAGAGFVAGLLRSPLWLVGFGVVFLVGTPLNIVAAAWLGPAILPGLMSLGLVVLTVGAVTVAGERLGAADVAGVALVMAGIALIGLSHLADRRRFFGPARFGPARAPGRVHRGHHGPGDRRPRRRGRPGSPRRARPPARARRGAVLLGQQPLARGVPERGRSLAGGRADR